MKKQKFSPRDSKKTDKESKPFNKDFYGKRSENPVGKNAKKKKEGEDTEEYFSYNNSASEKEFKSNIRKEKPSMFQKSSKPLSDKKDYKKRAYGEDKDKGDFKERKSIYTKKENSFSSRKESSDNFKDANKEKPYHKKSIFDKDDDKKKSNSFGKPYSKKPYQKKEFNSDTYKKSKATSTPKHDDGLIRLNKFIANAGICSRREADELIAAGAITVNGKTITELGFRIKPTDMVNYGGQGLKAEKMVYVLLNKPKDYITTSDDPQDRRTVMSLVQGACKERLYSVGRLDRNTTGLLLLTNDGALTERITHPSYNQKKIYHVELDVPLKKEHLLAIKEGIELEDGNIKVDDIEYVSGVKTNTEVGVTIHSGRNRIVRRIFEHFEYKIKKLDRVYYAGLTKKDLPRGRWRMLTTAEVNMLKMMN